MFRSVFQKKEDSGHVLHHKGTGPNGSGLFEQKNDRGVFEFMGVKVSSCDEKGVLAKIEKAFSDGNKNMVFTLNAHHVYLLYKDPCFAEAYAKASLILADGISIVLASKLLGGAVKRRCCGSDVFRQVFLLAAKLNKRVFVLGGTNGAERTAQQKLAKEFPGVEVELHSPSFGYHDDPARTASIIERINKSRADIVLICTGSPKSERWLSDNMGDLKAMVTMSLGDSLNIYAGQRKRAPLWMQHAGLEWFFRLIQEPGRLSGRYFVTNMFFVFVLIRELYRKRCVQT